MPSPTSSSSRTPSCQPSVHPPFIVSPSPSPFSSASSTSKIQLLPLLASDIPACAALASLAFRTDRHTQFKARDPDEPYDHEAAMRAGLRHWLSVGSDGPAGSIDEATDVAGSETGTETETGFGNEEGKGMGVSTGTGSKAGLGSGSSREGAEGGETRYELVKAVDAEDPDVVLGWVCWGRQMVRDGEGNSGENGEDDEEGGEIGVDGGGTAALPTPSCEKKRSIRSRLESFTSRDLRAWQAHFAALALTSASTTSTTTASAATSAESPKPADPTSTSLPANSSTTQSPPSPSITFIATLAVHPAHTGRGIGSSLIRHVTERADRLGAKCWVHASDSPAALAVYRQAGFREVGRLRLDLDDWNEEGWEGPGVQECEKSSGQGDTEEETEVEVEGDERERGGCEIKDNDNGDGGRDGDEAKGEEGEGGEAGIRRGKWGVYTFRYLLRENRDRLD